WVAPVALYMAVLAAHLVHPPWRTRRAVPFLLTAALIALPIGAFWPLALAARSPVLLAQWWAASTQGSFGASLRYLVDNAGWFAWPAWPLALWALWSSRRRWPERHIFVHALTILLMLPGLAVWAQAQTVTLIPMLAPLVMLAVQGLPSLRRGGAAALAWFGLVTFAFFGGLVWLRSHAPLARHAAAV